MFAAWTVGRGEGVGVPSCTRCGQPRMDISGCTYLCVHPLIYQSASSAPGLAQLVRWGQLVSAM